MALVVTCDAEGMEGSCMLLALCLLASTSATAQLLYEYPDCMSVFLLDHGNEYSAGQLG